MKIDPTRKYRAVCARSRLPDRTWPSRVIDEAAGLVQRRPARRQPGADRADGRRAQAPHVPAAREDGLQGDRDRLPGRVADRLRLRAAARRAGPDPRRRQRAGADAGARAADRAHVRVAPGRQARDHAPLQLDVDHAAARRVRPRPRRHQADRGRRGSRRARLRGEAAGHRVDVPVLAGELHRHRARLREGGLRRGARRVAADARSARRSSTFRRRSRWPRPTSTPTRSSGCTATSRAATASCSRCIRTTTAAAAWPRPSSA